MATQITNYQCPACTGPLHYSGESGKLVCDYCGSAYTPSEIEQMYAEKEQAAEAAAARAKPAEAGTLWADTEAAGMRVYGCPSCRAELMCDETTAATSCPYCGNPTVIPGQLGGSLRPEFVLPFRLEKRAAEQALKKYYKGKKFLPNAFKNGNHIHEIKGVYVPFWLFNGNAEGQMSFEGCRIEHDREGDYKITRTHHFHVERAGTMQFRQVPVDGSSKIPDAHMDAIEPFNYSELKPFSTAYLPGFLAEKYDVDAQASQPRAQERMQTSLGNALRSTVHGYATVMPLSEAVHVDMEPARYALMPVWMLHTKWNGQNFLFAMNGQTGKLIGDLPVDKGKVAAWFAGTSLPLMAVLALLMLL